MSDDKSYSSDSETDDDYRPENDDAESCSESDTENGRKRKQTDDVDLVDDVDVSNVVQSKRNKYTRTHSNENIDNETDQSTDVDNGKDADDKEKADRLWSDFLKEDPTTRASIDTKSIDEKKIEIKPIVVSQPVKPKPNPLNSFLLTKSNNKAPPFMLGKRPAAGGGTGGGGGGLGSVLGQLAKKNKISTLDKSKQDWNSFKQKEGISEELETHNKGRDGYLERKDFLERTDFRQFEIEKNLRLKRSQ